MNISPLILRLQLLWQQRTGALRKRRFKSLDTLDEATLEQIHKEAGFLRTQHSVSVRKLAPDERPDIPRRADE